jgi:hypothetical protein
MNGATWPPRELLGMKSGTTSSEVRCQVYFQISLFWVLECAEAQARQAFLATLAVDVINPLTALKVNCLYFASISPSDLTRLQETQDRTRKRIKEDLKDSGMAYNEYAETTLPKLKAKYSQKFSEVEVRAIIAIPLFPLLTRTCKRNKRRPQP